MDTERLNRRVTGRHVADCALDLVFEQAAAFQDEPDMLTAYWEQIRDKVEPHLPKRPQPTPSREPPRVVPMLASEVVEFEKEQIEFGQHAGRSIGWLSKNEPGYLRWLAGLDLTDKLRRYLANEQIAAMIDDD